MVPNPAASDRGTLAGSGQTPVCRWSRFLDFLERSLRARRVGPEDRYAGGAAGTVGQPGWPLVCAGPGTGGVPGHAVRADCCTTVRAMWIRRPRRSSRR
jgi:hypothetical protein